MGCNSKQERIYLFLSVLTWLLLISEFNWIYLFEVRIFFLIPCSIIAAVVLVQFMIQQAWSDCTLWATSPSEVYLCNFMPSADSQAAYQTARSCKVCASGTWAAWAMFFWPVNTYLKRKDNQLYIWLWQRLARLGDVGDLKDWTVRSPIEGANSARQSVIWLSARLCTVLSSQMPDQGPSSRLWCATCANPSSWFCGGPFRCSILFEHEKITSLASMWGEHAGR